MKKLVVLLLPALLLAQTTETCEVLTLEGNVEFREPHENAWQPASQGLLLEDKTTLRSSAGSARIKDYSGKEFILPASAQIIVNELRPLSRNDIIRELTAMELQKLPAERNSSSQNGFVLHGSDPALQNQDALDAYFELEENGAYSLYTQGYMAGFILKWHRLKTLMPEVTSERIEIALAEAYQQMQMPIHEKALRDQ